MNIAYAYLVGDAVGQDKARFDARLLVDHMPVLRYERRWPVLNVLTVGAWLLQALRPYELTGFAYRVCRAGRPFVPPHFETPSSTSIDPAQVKTLPEAPEAAQRLPGPAPAALPPDVARLISLGGG